MATRSTIAVIDNDGTVKQVYCHWDGYLSYNGRLLKQEYNSLKLANELVSFGDMSILAENINPTHPDHSYDSAQEGVCVYYGRDRGESNTDPKVFKDLNEFLDKRMDEEYNYLFKDGQWLVSYYKNPHDFVPFDYKEEEEGY